MNPAFHFVSGWIFFRAAHVSCTWHFLARKSMYMGCARLRDNSRARLPLLCTYRLHVCPHVRYVRVVPAQRSTAIFARLYTAIFAHPLETA
jgi:hypothetical protein